MGIEPTSSAWKAEVLPLNYTRTPTVSLAHSAGLLLPHQAPSDHSRFRSIMVEGGGFEPPKAEPTDLQSVPVDRLGTPPNDSRALSKIIKTLSTAKLD